MQSDSLGYVSFPNTASVTALDELGAAYRAFRDARAACLPWAAEFADRMNRPFATTTARSAERQARALFAPEHARRLDIRDAFDAPAVQRLAAVFASASPR